MHNTLLKVENWMASNTIQIEMPSGCCQLRKISMILKFMDLNNAKQLAYALVLSHPDYSNNILCGLPKSSISLLQRLQKWAAKFDSSTEAIIYLDWLPIKELIKYMYI